MTNRHVKIINYKWNNETFLASATVKSKKKFKSQSGNSYYLAIFTRRFCCHLEFTQLIFFFFSVFQNIALKWQLDFIYYEPGLISSGCLQPYAEQSKATSGSSKEKCCEGQIVCALGTKTKDFISLIILFMLQMLL